jgi:hypothetical protein
MLFLIDTGAMFMYCYNNVYPMLPHQTEVIQ